ncbi:DNA-binding transcriptional ArsR family regulator [Saccharomonospora amisosensis]|uniref:DNA-binding transcriptional ArsR family regulator n=1 Tax=Saccharomonospora amisosensis TaxID=1128677 RepID=A0A7X5ULQ1_9PSEU|nr:winged helix-turn-helix domain-containing protein [Saccharomonospora amisosensis]NIJ10325.1 DNA-binding transcriptional ArsR family regulator [Saccharomonospora amisosensis]
MSAAELAELASLLADRTRARFCLALLDGRAWTAGELASLAGVAPATASEHLDRLLAGGLLGERRQGRHRYVRLADHRAAHLIEGLLSHLDPTAERHRTLRTAAASSALASGRTCYDHLAGRLGVAITDAMTARGLLDLSHGCALTGDGMDWLTGALRIAPDELRAGRRPLVKCCLDATERRSHLAGAAGAKLCLRMFDNGWVKRIGTGRAVRLTPSGVAALQELLAIDTDSLAAGRAD